MIGQTNGSCSDVICVDACLEREIKYLWSIGISTTGCCCGHNKVDGYIGVIDEDISKMKRLSYELIPNNGRQDSFKPKFIVNL